MIAAFLTQPWAGLPLALAVLLIGGILRRSSSRTVYAVGSVAGVSGVALLLGATLATYKSNHGIAPPGKLLDVGGYQVHLWCEGKPSDTTIVWLPGGYGQGLWSYANHVDVQDEARSCVIDRHGLGWSDAGPTDFSAEQIADEVMSALELAGESPPFLLAGHSFGGFYATNTAALYPDEVAGVVLLDPTAPGWIDYFAYSGCGSGNPSAKLAFASLFGLAWIEALNPLLQDPQLRQRMGDWWPAFIAQELRPASFWAQAAALSSPCTDMLSHARWPGQLGDTPLLLITQTPEIDVEDDMAPMGGFRLDNYKRFKAELDGGVLSLSSNAYQRLAPPGSGHDFPTTEPEFTKQQVLSFLRCIRETPQCDITPKTQQ